MTEAVMLEHPSLGAIHDKVGIFCHCRFLEFNTPLMFQYSGNSVSISVDPVLF